MQDLTPNTRLEIPAKTEDEPRYLVIGLIYTRLEIPAKTEDEPRYLVIGLIYEKCWSAVITYRGANIRIISVRRSRTEEVELYES
jgi:uncharacterized DUF497 family protein